MPEGSGELLGRIDERTMALDEGMGRVQEDVGDQAKEIAALRDRISRIEGMGAAAVIILTLLVSALGVIVALKP